MNRWVIRGLFGTVLFLVGIVAFLFLAPLILPKGTIRQTLLGQLVAATGAQVSAKRFSYQLLPHPRFFFEELAFRSAVPGASATARTITIELSFRDLARRSSAEGKILINGLKADLLGEQKSLDFLRELIARLATSRLESLTIRNASLIVRRASPLLLPFVEEAAAVDRRAPLVIERLQISVPTPYQLATAGVRVSIKGNLLGEPPLPISLVGLLHYDRIKKSVRLSKGEASMGPTPLSLQTEIFAEEAALPNRLEIASEQFEGNSLLPLFPWLTELAPPKAQLSGTFAGRWIFTVNDEGIPFEAEHNFLAAAVAVDPFFSKAASYPLTVSIQGSRLADRLKIAEARVKMGNSESRFAGEIMSDAARSTLFQGTLESFDLLSGKTAFPFLVGLSELVGATLTTTYQGSWQEEGASVLRGRFAAAKLAFVGFAAEGVTASFERDGDAILLPLIKGTFGGQSFSGTGKLVFGQTASYGFDLVFDSIDAASLPAAARLLEGKGSMVMALTTEGKSAADLLAHLNLNGSFIATDITMKPFDTTPLAAELKAKGVEIPALTGADQKAADFKGAFQAAGGAATFSNVAFRTPRFEVALTLQTATAQGLEGNGKLIVSKPQVGGNMTIPCRVREEGGKIVMSLDQTAFEGAVKGTVSSGPNEAFPSLPALPGPPATTPESARDATPAPPASVQRNDKRVRPKRAAQPKPAEDAEAVEDVMKIQIGR